MELKLFKNTTLRELKTQFAKKFPFLKLEFFKKAHRKEEGSAYRWRVSDNVLLSELKGFHKEGVFSFQPAMIVSDFEQQLQNEFGLSVQVFRKAGDLWIETIQTDKLSLEKQNAMGEAASNRLPFNINSLFL